MITGPRLLDIASQHTTLTRRPSGAYVGLCPLHRERTPSFTINDRLDLFYCFGCGAGGDVHTFMRMVEGAVS